MSDHDNNTSDSFMYESDEIDVFISTESMECILDTYEAVALNDTDENALYNAANALALELLHWPLCALADHIQTAGNPNHRARKQ